MKDETIDNWEPEVNARPSLLTELCIFTWLVSAYTLFTAPVSYFFTSSMESEQTMTEFNDAMAEMGEDDPEVAKFFEPFMDTFATVASNSLENAGMIFATDMLIAILSAFGAFFMFRLKKQGFWIYLSAKVVSLLSVFVFIGVNVASVMWVSFGSFIGLIVVALYAINLKHMN